MNLVASGDMLVHIIMVGLSDPTLGQQSINYEKNRTLENLVKNAALRSRWPLYQLPSTNTGEKPIHLHQEECT